MSTERRNKRYIKDITNIAICASIMVVSSWLTIPFYIPFTLQTLAILIITSVLTLKTAFLSILLYILIGLAGIPVFSGFGAGLSAIAGPTGGFLLSFLMFPFIMKLFSYIHSKIFWLKVLSMSVCIAVCYICGALWYAFIYGASNDPSIIGVLSVCVFPFILPDAIKILLAAVISIRLEKLNL